MITLKSFNSEIIVANIAFIVVFFKLLLVLFHDSHIQWTDKKIIINEQNNSRLCWKIKRHVLALNSSKLEQLATSSIFADYSFNSFSVCFHNIINIIIITMLLIITTLCSLTMNNYKSVIYFNLIRKKWNNSHKSSYYTISIENYPTGIA